MKRYNRFVLELKLIELDCLFYQLFLNVDSYESTDYDLDHSQDLNPKIFRCCKKVKCILENVVEFIDKNCKNINLLKKFNQDYCKYKKKYVFYCKKFEYNKINFE